MKSAITRPAGPITLHALLGSVLLSACIGALFATYAAAQAAAETPSEPFASQTWSANIDDIRRVAGLIPGEPALRINVLKFAESHRTKDISVKGAPAEPSIQARTVFQVVFPDGTMMIDSGMDETVHKLLGRGAVEPYFPAATKQVNAALRRAKIIVMTHEHGDHVAGVVRGPLAAELAPKTVLTRTQVQTLLTKPQFPEIRLTPEAAARFIVLDYDRYYPFAPGVALIKAPGHTPGSQMIFVRLQSGKEFLFVGDAAWLMDNIRLLKGKNSPNVVEDEPRVMDELQWLHDLMAAEKNLVIVVSHDDDEHKQLIADHVMGNKLE